jgi:hypothetical protein
VFGVCYLVGVELFLNDMPGWVFAFIVVVVLPFLCVVVAMTSGLYLRWLFWRPITNERRLWSVLQTVFAIALVVFTFSVFATALVDLGWISLHGYPTTVHGRRHVMDGVQVDFAWNIFNAIPALGIPKTLNWSEPARRFGDHGGGVLMLTFKLLVILPLVSLIAQLVQRPASNTSAAS